MRQVPLRTCTTTVAKIASTSTVAVNNYFPRRLEPLRKRTLRRYNPETPSVDRMHVLNEMLEFCTVIESSLRCPSFAVPPSRGNPEAGITPPSCMTRSRHTSFCTGTSMSYRDRNVAVAPFPFHRRGTFFLPPWRQMPRIMLMSTFS